VTLHELLAALEEEGASSPGMPTGWLIQMSVTKAPSTETNTIVYEHMYALSAMGYGLIGEIFAGEMNNIIEFEPSFSAQHGVVERVKSIIAAAPVAA